MKEYLLEDIKESVYGYLQFNDIAISDYVTYNFFIKFLRPKDKLFKAEHVKKVLSDSYFKHMVELVIASEESDRYFVFKAY